MLRRSPELLRRSLRGHASARLLASARVSPSADPSLRPFAGASGATADAAADATKRAPPELAEVPSLPFVGSWIPQYSGIPAFDPTAFYDFYPEMRRRFGDWYKVGFPGLGKGRRGTMYVLTDPVEVHKILRQERGTHPYPRGAIEAEWPLIEWLHEIDSPLGSGTNGEEDRDGYFGRGETWKRQRTFLQTDLLSPQAAKGYIPGMVKAAELASKGAAAARADLNSYTNHCSFDLFCTVMLGELTELADPNTETDAENAKFCSSVCKGLEAMMAQMMSPLKLGLFKMGIKTRLYKDMAKSLNEAREINLKKYNMFKERSIENNLTENEYNSYLGRAIARQASEESNINESELSELISTSLTAAIDTTSALLNWNIINLALNSCVQEKLYAELESNVAAYGGRLNEEVIKKSNSPYLHGVVRESHRLTPAIPLSVMKEPVSDIEIHETVVPKGSLVCLDSYSIGIDPDFVADPDEFRPERWLPESVESRKGTPLEIIDHPFYRDPFSQGSRKCPGSRVASNEVLVMLAQLVLDWKFLPLPGVESLKDIDYGIQLMVQPKMPQLNFVARK